jgi:integrase
MMHEIVIKCHTMKIVKTGNARVKIYKGESGGYDLFTVVHYRDGKRIRENFRKERDATSRAQEIATAIEKGRVEVLQLTNSDRESYLAATRALQPLGIPLHVAIEEFVAARTQLSGDSILAAVKEHLSRKRNVQERRADQVVDELLADYRKSRDKGELRPKYVYQISSDLTRFKNAFHVNISAVTPALIEDWLKGQDITARTRNNLRASIVTLFNFAKRRGYLPRGIRTDAEDVPRAKEPGGKIGILTPKQLASVISKVPTDVQLYLALGAFTGMRTSEMLRLDWSQVNFERGHITVAPEKAKTATRRLVPIQPNLMQWLAPYRKHTGHIFDKYVNEHAISLASSHGIAWPHNCLRHSYASYRLAAVPDAARVALEMGNSPQKLMTNYRELADEYDAAAWFAISPKRSKKIVRFAA